MAKPLRRSYGGLLSQPMYRPDLVVTALIWRSKNNADLLPHWDKVSQLIAEFEFTQEQSHFESMAISRGVVKKSPFGGIFPNYVWHDGWQHDLMVSLAKEVYPQFAGVKIKGRGATRKPLDIELFKAISLKKAAGHSQLRACSLLSTDRKSPWYRKSAKGLNEKFNRILAELKKPKQPSGEFERFNEFARRRLRLPEKSE